MRTLPAVNWQNRPRVHRGSVHLISVVELTKNESGWGEFVTYLHVSVLESLRSS